MSLSFEAASLLHQYANIALIIAAAMTVLATIVVVRMSNIKEVHLRADITEAVVRAEEATAQAEQAKAASADANMRAAQLEKEAETAKLETEQIKQTLAWRAISEEGAAILKNELSNKPGSVNLRYVDGDPETLYFAIQISEIMRDSGWIVEATGVKASNYLAFGIFLPDSGSEHTQTLRDAFASIGGTYSKELPPMQIGFNTSKIEAIMFIGTKDRALR